jgi:hypothetical protein
MFDQLPIHDATLKEIQIEWAEGTCTLNIDTHSGTASSLVFQGVTRISVSRDFPWGRSVSVNAARQTEAGRYDIEMQSGDTVSVCASSWQFNWLVGTKNLWQPGCRENGRRSPWPTRLQP